MTLLITVIAAIVSTIIWYRKDSQNKMKIGNLSLIYWGASLMWGVDEIFEYVKVKEEYFKTAVQIMINDAFLGLCIVVLGMLIWMGYVLVQVRQMQHIKIEQPR